VTDVRTDPTYTTSAAGAPAPASAPQRILVFDIVRVIAVISIVFFHVSKFIFKAPYTASNGLRGLYWVSIGGVGVTVFIVLSGAVLQHVYGQRDTPYWAFEIKRLARIYPLYWVSLVATVLMIGIISPYKGGVTRLATDILGIRGVIGATWDRTDMLSPVTWFIGVIVGLYLLFPLIKRLLAWQPKLTLLAMFVISVAARLWAYRAFGGFGIHWFIPGRLFEFTLGMWIVADTGLVQRAETALQFVGPRARGVIGYLSTLAFAVYVMHETCRIWLTTMFDKYSHHFWAIPGSTIRSVVWLTLYLILTWALSEAAFRLAAPIEKAILRVTARRTR